MWHWFLSLCPKLPPDAVAMKKVLLTGASAGIGLETAKELVAAGHEVWGVARSLERLPVMERFHPVVMDLTDAASMERAFCKASAESGGFDVLINNAGSGILGRSDLLSAADWAEQFHLLCVAPMQMVRLAMPGMIGRGRGLIVNVTSLAARFSIPCMGAYSAAKAALGNATSALRMEFAGTPIRIVELQPGDVNTGFNHAMRRVVSGKRDEGVVDEDFLFGRHERNLATAPPPRKVARKMLDIVEGRETATVVACGDWFQACLAPLLARLSPHGWVEWGIRKFYRIR